ncbi:MAG TPA: hypothetical protein VGN88_01050, partial [Phycisphaerae bacterium]
GSVWVNGHNIGPYKNTSGTVDMYVPECWLAADGKNTVVIFDAEGSSPAGVTLEARETWETIGMPK